MSGAGAARGPGLPALDGLRAISIACVLAAHLLPLGPKDLRLNEAAGAMGMSLFFALSGFLILRALHSDGIVPFAVKRMARILPLAALFCLAAFLLFSQSPAQLLAGLGFVLNYMPGLMIPQTEHLWSLCVEVHFYLFAAALAACGRRMLALVWPCCLAVTALRMSQGAQISILTHLRIDEILAGACVASALQLSNRTIPARRGGPLRAQAVWSAAALVWFAAAHPAGGALQYLRPYSAALLLAASLALPAGCRLSRLLGSRQLSHVAAISYALYVLHPLTARGWWDAGSLSERYGIKRPLGFALTLAAAHLSTYHWERWWIAAARRALARRSPGGSIAPAPQALRAGE